MLKQTMKPSKFCSIHINKPVFARGLCKNCYNKWLTVHNPDYLNKQRENCKQWSKANKIHKKKYQKNWRAKRDKDYNFIRNLRGYGMTIDDYNNILLEQKGVCAICKKAPKNNRRLHIDHDHQTGLIRGLLCFRCNFGLSYFAENVITIKYAYEYLQKEHKKFNIESHSNQDINIIINSVTKTIKKEDKLEIQELRQLGLTISELHNKFPQYSSSAIYRASKENNDATTNPQCNQ
jgi:hypothetical protein